MISKRGNEEHSAADGDQNDYISLLKGTAIKICLFLEPCMIIKESFIRVRYLIRTKDNYF